MYHPPKSLHNDSDDWKLPPIEQLLADLRKQGGRIDGWLREHIEDEDAHPAVLMILAETLNAPGNEEHLKRFAQMRASAEQAVTWIAEDRFYEQATSGKKEHKDQTRALLERRNASKWSTKGSAKTQETQEAQEQLSSFEDKFDAACHDEDEDDE